MKNSSVHPKVESWFYYRMIYSQFRQFRRMDDDGGSGGGGGGGGSSSTSSSLVDNNIKDMQNFSFKEQTQLASSFTYTHAHLSYFSSISTAGDGAWRRRRWPWQCAVVAPTSVLSSCFFLLTCLLHSKLDEKRAMILLHILCPG